MKVAILSMQQIKNYGSFLQAFSLKKNIESLGHTCEFINIIPGEQLEGYKTSCIWERTECKSDHYVCSILWCDYYRQITTCRQKGNCLKFIA